MKSTDKYKIIKIRVTQQSTIPPPRVSRLSLPCTSTTAVACDLRRPQTTCISASYSGLETILIATLSLIIVASQDPVPHIEPPVRLHIRLDNAEAESSSECSCRRNRRPCRTSCYAWPSLRRIRWSPSLSSSSLSSSSSSSSPSSSSSSSASFSSSVTQIVSFFFIVLLENAPYLVIEKLFGPCHLI